MSSRHPVREPFETALAWVGFTLIPLLPRWMITGLAFFIGNMLTVCPGRHRDLAAANINLAFKESIDNRSKRLILRRSFIFFSLITLDIFWFGRNTKRRLDKYREYQGGPDA